MIIVLLAIAVFPLAARCEDNTGFRPLFDGKTLSGWVQRGGKAKYEAVDGMIVGTSVPNTSNSFLCTEKNYSDFTLTYEFLCDEELNSGVQIRSECYDEPKMIKIDGEMREKPAGRVFGYQVEIDPNHNGRMWVGGVYDEARRGWLFPGPAGGDEKAFTEQGAKLYRTSEWTQARVECKGDHIRTWINGELRSDFRDSMTASGFIGLQVHDVGDRQDPLSVRWRNIQIKEH